MGIVAEPLTKITIDDWKRLLAAWSAAYCADPDERVLRACGVSVAQRIIAHAEADASALAPAGKAPEACLSGS